MPLNQNDPHDTDLETALTALVPLPGRLDRDALLFRAGQVSIRRRSWLWPGATVLLGLSTAVLGGLLLSRPSSPSVPRFVFVPVKEVAPPGPAASVPAPPAPAAEPAVGKSPMNYLQLEQQVLRWGLDGVPATPESPPLTAPPMTRQNLLGVAPAPALFSYFPYLGSFYQ